MIQAGTEKVSVDRFEEKLSPEELMYAYQEINTFEKTLTDDGAVLIKFFMHMSRKEQKRRFDKLLDNKETAWRVSKADLNRNEEYGTYKAMLEEMLEKTETECAPWTIIGGHGPPFCHCEDPLLRDRQPDGEDRGSQGRKTGKRRRQRKTEAGTDTETKEYEPLPKKVLESSTLSRADLTLAYTKEEYKKKLKDLQTAWQSSTASCTAAESLWYWDLRAGMQEAKEVPSNALQRPWTPGGMW